LRIAVCGLALTASIAALAPAARAEQRNVAEIVLADGLAMRTAHKQFPDRPFIDAPPGWLAEAAAKRAQILHDVRAVLNDSDGPTVAAFTTGIGPAGIAHEAGYAAWIVTGYLMAHGETDAEIAEVKSKDAPARVGEAIDKMLAEKGR